MSAIIYDARRIKAMERIQELGAYAGKSEKEIKELWMNIVLDDTLMKEFMYYLDHHMLQDEMKCEGYGLTDLYMWLMARYNLMQDYGKNENDCNKEGLVLDAFAMMAAMRKDPENYVKMLNDGFGIGMDQLG